MGRCNAQDASSDEACRSLHEQLAAYSDKIDSLVSSYARTSKSNVAEAKSLSRSFESNTSQANRIKSNASGSDSKLKKYNSLIAANGTVRASMNTVLTEQRQIRQNLNNIISKLEGIINDVIGKISNDKYRPEFKNLAQLLANQRQAIGTSLNEYEQFETQIADLYGGIGATNVANVKDTGTVVSTTKKTASSEAVAPSE